MADGSVIIKVEMETESVQAGVDDIKEGCGRAASAAERTGRSVTRAMSEGTRSMTAYGEDAQRVGTLVQASCGQVRDGMSSVTVENGRTRAALEQMRASLGAVRVSLGAAFAPVVTAAAPLLTKLCDLVARAANYVSRFFAILTGKSTYKRTVAAQDAITDSVAGTGKAAKEAAKNLSGLDELNIWQENKTGSGGGGGGGGGGTDADTEEVEVGDASDFVVRLKDILFEWDGLNPELIAEKILTGLCAAAGGIIGWTLGGPLGGLVGLTMGALLGVKISQLTFDGDGKLNKEEVAKLIVTAVLGLIGGVLGARIGGAKGAAIGFTIGAGVSVLMNKALFDGDGKLDKTEIQKLILTAVSGLLGGILGFAIGGPMGALIGFTIGAGVSVLLQNAAAEAEGGIGGWIKEKIFKPITAGIKAAGEFVVTAVVNLVKKVGEWSADAWAAIKDGARTIANKVTTSVQKAGAWFADAWDAVKDGARTISHTVTTALSKAGTWVKDAWTALTSGNKTTTVSTALKKASTWIANAWTALTKTSRTVTVSTALKKASTWIASAWTALTKTNRTVTVSTALKKASTWIANAWTALTKTSRTVTVSTALKRASTWIANAWTALTKTSRTVTVSTALKKARTWVSDAWTAISSGARKTITVTVSLLKSGWSAFRDWLGFSTGGIYRNGQWHRIEGYAGGGRPRSARLFYANENGMPELVGRIGSNTAVMNNGQIVASVAAGVYQAVAAAMGQIGGWFRVMSANLANIPPAIEMLAAMPARTPQPAMATGAVLPPRTLYVDGPVQGLADAVDSLRDALDRQSAGQTGVQREPTYNVNLNVDGRTLFQAVLRQGRLRALQNGGNPFLDLMGG